MAVTSRVDARYFIRPPVGDALNVALVAGPVDGWLLTLPRNIDVRLIYYRQDLFDGASERARFREATGRELGVPQTWEELAQVAKFFARPPDLFGFAFPGRDSGLFGTYFELVAMAGGKVFRPDLRPGFVDSAGRWALGFLRRLYFEEQVTPRDLPEMRYDELSEVVQQGRLAMVADWPGGFYRYRDPQHSSVSDRFSLAL